LDEGIFAPSQIIRDVFDPCGLMPQQDLAHGGDIEAMIGEEMAGVAPLRSIVSLTPVAIES
jgi:hypothetical protein